MGREVGMEGVGREGGREVGRREGDSRKVYKLFDKYIFTMEVISDTFNQVRWNPDCDWQYLSVRTVTKL